MSVLRPGVLTLLPFLLACGILGLEDDGRGDRDHPTLVAAIQGEGLVRIDPRDGEVMARWSVVEDPPDRLDDQLLDPVRLRDGQLAVGFGNEQDFVAFALQDFHEVWREKAACIRSRSSGLLGFTAVLAEPTPSGDAVLYYPTSLPDGKHIGVLDPGTRAFRPTHAGPINALAVKALPPGPVSSGGAILAFGRRKGNPRLEPSSLYLIDPRTMAFVDSIPEAELPSGVDRRIMYTDHDGRHILYWSAPDRVVLYDLVTRRVTAELAAAAYYNRIVFDPGSGRFAAYYNRIVFDPGSGRFAAYYNRIVFDPGSGRFAAFDNGYPFYHGTGIIQIFDEHLERTDVDLTTRGSYDGIPASVTGVAWGGDGLLYALTGNRWYGHAPRIVVIDPRSGEVLDIFTVGQSGDGPQFLWWVP